MTREEKVLEQCLTVGDLLKRLEKLDQETCVMLGHPSHDHWGTQLATPVTDVEEQSILWSNYHDQHKVKSPNSADGEGVATLTRVVLLS